MHFDLFGCHENPTGTALAALVWSEQEAGAPTPGVHCSPADTPQLKVPLTHSPPGGTMSWAPAVGSSDQCSPGRGSSQMKGRSIQTAETQCPMMLCCHH